MNKQAVFTGEKEDLQELVNLFFKATDDGQAPTIDEETDFLLPITQEEDEKKFQKWAETFDLKYFVITP
jgi:hypothetical protein